MASKRIFQLDDEGFLDDLTDKVYMWLDKKANEGEPDEPSWKFKANVFLKILNNMATKFVPNVATVVGKCYWHDGELFMCNVSYTGDWVPGNFTAITLGDLVTLYGADAATEADLVAGSKLPIMTAAGPKALPGNAFAPKSGATSEIRNLPDKYEGYFPLNDANGTGKLHTDQVLSFKTTTLTDCDNFLVNGIFNVETTFSNIPSEMAQNGVLLCFSSGTYRKVQVIVEYPVQANLNKRMWVRIRSGSSWTSWENVTTKQYVDSLINGLNTKISSLITYPNKSLSFDELPNVQTLLNTNTEPETAVARFVAYDLGTYNSFYFYTQTDVEVYFDDDVIESANYLSIMWGVNPAGDWVSVPDSPSHRRYIQCSSVTRKRKSNDDLPTSNSRLTIPAGSIIAFTQRNTDSAKVNINCYPQLTPSLPVPTPSPEPKKMKIKYTSSSSYQISFGDYECELYRVVNAEADADNWNVVHISRNGNDIIGRWTDIIGPLKLSGDSDFIGGVHGSETTTSLNVYSGSKKLTLDSSLDEEFEKLTITMTSTCRRASNQSNAFNRRVCVEITRNKMRISSEFVCIAESSLTVTRVTNGGLISANNNVILGCYMNNYSCDGYPLAAPNNQSKNNIHAVIVTTLGTIVVNNLQGKEQADYNGYFELFATEEVPRTKVYFCPLYGTEKSVSSGDSFYGECEYIFEP